MTRPEVSLKERALGGNDYRRGMTRRLRVYHADGTPGAEAELRDDGTIEGGGLTVCAGCTVALIDTDIHPLPVRFDRTKVVTGLL